MKRGAISSIILSIVIIATVLFSVAYLFIVDPEHAQVTSLDGKVTVAGLTRTSQTFSVDATEALGGGTLAGPVYHIEPSNIVLENPVTITFDTGGRERAMELIVYRYDDALQMWEEQEALTTKTDSLMALETDTLGVYSLGYALDVETPTFLSVYDELLEMAPENAVGYELAVAVGGDGEPHIQVPDTIQVGGCGGLLQQGNREELSILEKDLRVLVADVDTLTRFTFVARWFVNDLGGCAQDQNLESF